MKADLYVEKNNAEYDLETEKQAVAQFERINRNSSQGLRIIQQRMLTSFIVLLCLTLLLGAFSIQTNNQSTKDINEMFQGPLTVRLYALRMNIYILEAHSALRDLAFIDSDDYYDIHARISRSEENVSKANRTFAVLRSLAEENELLRPSFDELSALLSEWDDIRKVCNELALSGMIDECLDNLVINADPHIAKINSLVSRIVEDATAIAAENHELTLNRSKQYDINSVIFSLIILTCGLFVLMYVRRHTDKSIALVEDAQREQNKIIDQIIIMDEALRENFAQLEAEGKLIEYMAYHDAVTDLPNRAYFIRKLDEAISRSRKSRASGCVFFIDLDNFKLINDNHGHEFGDELLVSVARKLKSVMDESALVARFGGDEFLIMIENIYGNAVETSVKKIMDAFSKPLEVGDSLCYITASVGITLFPEDGCTVNEILKNSDAAMYESKYAGRNTFAFYYKDMSEKAARKSAISDALRGAVDDGSIYMVYQPRYNFVTGRVVGIEALMRIKNEALIFSPPDEFIPVAEENRLIIPLGYWAIRKAIETDLILHEQGFNFEHISVNVSEIQLRESDFVGNLKEIFKEYDYDPSRFHLEITESLLLNELEKKIDIFNQLRSLGVKIELDDFGTGYSSLNYVRLIPLDVLKIDKCFIDEIGVSNKKEELIDLVINLARMFGAQVVAEGVETEAQLKFIKQRGEILVQGYYYSKPLDEEALPEKLKVLNEKPIDS